MLPEYLLLHTWHVNTQLGFGHMYGLGGFTRGRTSFDACPGLAEEMLRTGVDLEAPRLFAVFLEGALFCLALAEEVPELPSADLALALALEAPRLFAVFLEGAFCCTRSR